MFLLRTDMMFRTYILNILISENILKVMNIKKIKLMAILAFEVLNTFHCKATDVWVDNTEMDLFNNLLKGVNLVMIQSKLKEKKSMGMG